MKRIIWVLVIFVLLVGCEGKKDPLAQYQAMSATQLYDSANSNLKKGNYTSAIQEFSALNNLYPFGTYTEQAQLNLIYAYYKDDDMPSALAEADRYIHMYPRSQHVDYAYYMKGVISYKDGLTWLQQFFGVNPAARNIKNLQESYLSFNELVQRFPSSVYRDDALAHMAYIRNQVAQQEIVIAKLYMYHKAYIAAINRATDVINNYPQSPAVVKAMAINVKAYRALNQPELADRYLKLLGTNYPESSEYRRLSS
ncbi:MAG TPA: outer membrane protein assembly factor BamD [Coxiellaceae bacterium]|nr:outer membrane protein assembly factor BamD [Coxiellaceae bacterium]